MRKVFKFLEYIWMRCMVFMFGVNRQYRLFGGKTMLMLAIKHNNIKAVKYLLVKDADVNIEDNKGKTALYYAEGNEELKKLLMSSYKELKEAIDIIRDNVDAVNDVIKNKPNEISKELKEAIDTISYKTDETDAVLDIIQEEKNEETQKTLKTIAKGKWEVEEEEEEKKEPEEKIQEKIHKKIGIIDKNEASTSYTYEENNGKNYRD